VLNGDVLGDLIKAGIDGADPKDRVALFREMGAAIVAHVQSAAIVTSVVVGTSPSGAVTGSATGTIT
jgi:hypothetical protein